MNALSNDHHLPVVLGDTLFKVVYQLITSKFHNCTVKPVVSGHSKVDNTKILMINGSSMQVKKNCRMLPLEHSSILLTCIKK